MTGAERRVQLTLAGLLLATLALAGCQDGGGFQLGPRADNEEDMWGIRCLTLQGPDQHQLAENYAKALRQVAGLKADLVRVLSDADGTTVFYGRYRRVYRAGAGEESFEPDPRKDLELIRSLRLQGNEVWPFILASMDALPTYRSAHPEWDLTNVDGYWSLQVGVFYNTEEFRSRRSAAEEYCRILRQQGEEAYFHHGAAQSSVCIGIYPRGAVTETRREAPLAGRTTLAAQITDPKMQEVQKRFPECLHNGHRLVDVIRDPQTGEEKARVPTPSFPVMLPRAHQPPASPAPERG